MSENQGSVAVVTVKEQSFLDNDGLKQKLGPLLKSLKTASKAAIEVLEKALESPDEKVRVSAAEKLLQFYMQTAKEINNDQVQRLIAELKLHPNRKPMTPVGNSPSGAPKPIVDFSTIRDV